MMIFQLFYLMKKLKNPTFYEIETIPNEFQLKNPTLYFITKLFQSFKSKYHYIILIVGHLFYNN